MNILVTGGAGFIGSHMAKRHLQDGHRVVVVDDLSAGKREKVPAAARFVQADIAEADLTPLLSEEKIEWVSHHAAQIDLRHSVADPIHDARSNILGSLKLFEACRRAGTRRVLFSSTGGALYGEPEDGRPSRETHPTNPVSPYGCAKLSIEKYLHYYRMIHGFTTQVFRYANVYGPGQNGTGEAGVVAIFAEAILAGRRPKIRGDGGQTRDYVYVGDVARANVLALETPGCTGALNIGTGLETTVLDLARRLAHHAGVTTQFSHGPAKPGEQRRSSVDPAAAGKALGWTPEVPLDSGLARTAESFKRAR